MIVNKITTGFVVQIFDTEKNTCIGQDFIAGDQVEIENEYGESIDGTDLPYHPFTMVQPE